MPSKCVSALARMAIPDYFSSNLKKAPQKEMKTANTTKRNGDICVIRGLTDARPEVFSCIVLSILFSMFSFALCIIQLCRYMVTSVEFV